MYQQLYENTLDKIVEGKLSPDELPSFWLWIKKMFKNPKEPFDIPYLRTMKTALFDACKEFPQYHKFYLDNLVGYDASFQKNIWDYDDKGTDFELAQDLKEISNTWNLPDDLSKVIHNLIYEYEKPK